MKLVGLDFETANPRNGSICAAGITIMQNGEIIEKREWLIRPHRTLDWMLPAFTEIHGIGYYDLRRSPEFFEIWPAIKNLIERGECVVIHNALWNIPRSRRLPPGRGLGRKYSSLLSLTAGFCPRHPKGPNKGKHSPAL